MRIVDSGSGASWRDTEQYWIRFYREEVNASLLNLTFGGDGILGLVHSKETRARMSATHKARFDDPQVVEQMTRIRNLRVNLHRSPSIETREKISLSLKGFKHSDETRSKMSSFKRTGRPQSFDSRQKISNSLKSRNTQIGSRAGWHHTEESKLLMTDTKLIRADLRRLAS
jgi:hypothetical protein